MLSLPTDVRNAALEFTFSFIDRFIPVRGRKIYEVGCDRQFASAKEFVRMGALSVTCTNITDNIATALIQNEPQISFHKVDASKSTFKESSFDIVYGRAVLEHIHQPSAIALETHRLLRPGGLFYFDGGPMWTSIKGHHVWVRGLSGARYEFPEHNPFQPWEHLLYPRTVMRTRLIDRGVPAPDAEQIVSHVYDSADQSRIAPQTIVDAFNTIPSLEMAVVRIAVGGDPPVVGKFSEVDLRTGGLVLIGRKLQSSDRRGELIDFVSAGIKLVRGQRFVN